MPGWAISKMGGEIPIQDVRLLPEMNAAGAWNVDLDTGSLSGRPVPELVRNMAAVPGTVARAYRFPGPLSTDPDAWLPLPSPYSSVVRSPLANDSLHRIYWTNPGQGAFWNTYARIVAGLPPYTLGYLPVEVYWVPVASPVGGTSPTVVPYVSRSYVFTYVNQYGEESAPSIPSVVVEGASDAVWTIYGMSNVPPTSFSGAVYPTVVAIKVYRTITGASTGAQFYYVGTIAIPPGVDPSVGWVDTTLDQYAALNPLLYSTSFAPPVPLLDGLTQLPGGMLVGFTGNTLHFSEPDRPHAWPAAYDLSTNFEIVGLGVWQSSLVILTKGFPSTGTGTSPSAFVLQQVQVSAPCISRGSIVTDLLGVYYASPDGLTMLNYYGMQNATIQLIDRYDWVNFYVNDTLTACRHSSQYLALRAPGAGYAIDFADPRVGLVQLSTFAGSTCIWPDIYSGDIYIMANKIVYRWDSPTTPPLIWRWLSKRFSMPKPISLGACQIDLSPAVLSPPPAGSIALDNGDPLMVLPAGVNALFRLYTDDGNLIMTRNLTKTREVFRLPSGFRSTDWQVELVSRVEITKVKVASSMHELTQL